MLPLLLGALAGVVIATVALYLYVGRDQGAVANPADPAADTVTVDRPDIDLGRVPLNQTVPVSVRLTNQSQRTIILGHATVETLEGC